MGFDRRSLLRASAAAAGLAVAGCDDNAKQAPATSPTKKVPAPPLQPEANEKPKGRPLPGGALEVLAAVSEQILPADDLGAGAKAAGVGEFLSRSLAEPRMRNLHGLLRRGAGFLNRAAHEEHQQDKFSALTFAEQTAILERLANNKYRPNRLHGPTFMRIMVALTLEGFFSDPVHGGNREGLGWKFAGYDPVGGRAAVFSGVAMKTKKTLKTMKKGG